MTTDREKQRLLELMDLAGRYLAENVEWGYLPKPCPDCGRTDEDAEACASCVDGLADPGTVAETTWYCEITLKRGWGTVRREHRGNIIRPVRDAVVEQRRLALNGIADLFLDQALEADRQAHRHHVRILTSKPLPPELEQVEWDGVEATRNGTGYLLTPDRARAVAVRLRGQADAPGRDTDADDDGAS